MPITARFAFAFLILSSPVWIFILLAAKSPAPPPCVTSPCSFATNITWETLGHLDTRPGTYGTTDVVTSNIPFTNVPAGYHVVISHLSGDEIAAPHGMMVAGGLAYALTGVTNTTPNQSPFVGPGLGSMGTIMYKQSPVGPSGSRIPINENVLGTLNPDNIMVLKQALFLSTAGVPIHFELTLVIQFTYVKG